MTPSINPSGARRKLLLLAALFVLPMLVAYALYYSGWRPETVHPHGELVQPARPVADAALVLLDGKPLAWLRYPTQDYPGMRAVVGPPEAVEAVAREFPLPAGGALDNLNRV